MSHNKPLLFCFVSYGNNRTRPVYIGLTISVSDMFLYIPVFWLHAKWEYNNYMKVMQTKILYTIYLQRAIMIYDFAARPYNLMAKRIWRLLHGQPQFFIACLSQNVGKAFFPFAYLLRATPRPEVRIGRRGLQLGVCGWDERTRDWKVPKNLTSMYSFY